MTDLQQVLISFEAQPMPTRTRQRVLFVCFNNEALSQLGAAFMRYFDPNQADFEAYSAACGPEVALKVHPIARKMIEDLGQSTQQLRTRLLSEFNDQYFDYVVVVGDRAVFEYQLGLLSLPSTRRTVCWPFPNPTALPDYLQSYNFHQVGEGLYSLVRGLTKLPYQGYPAYRTTLQAASPVSMEIY